MKVANVFKFFVLMFCGTFNVWAMQPIDEVKGLNEVISTHGEFISQSNRMNITLQPMESTADAVKMLFNPDYIDSQLDGELNKLFETLKKNLDSMNSESRKALSDEWIKDRSWSKEALLHAVRIGYLSLNNPDIQHKNGFAGFKKRVNDFIELIDNSTDFASFRTQIYYFIVKRKFEFLEELKYQLNNLTVQGKSYKPKINGQTITRDHLFQLVHNAIDNKNKKFVGLSYSALIQELKDTLITAKTGQPVSENKGALQQKLETLRESLSKLKLNLARLSAKLKTLKSKLVKK